MVVILGQVETPFIGREAFQEVDLPAFYGEITKWSATVPRADRLPELVAKGLRIATSGRPGPVMLAVPSDLLEEEVLVPDDRIAAATTARPAPGSAESEEMARQVAGAHQPVLIAGSKANDAREELVAFAETFGVGVYAAFRRQDVFPNDHPHYLGHLTLGTPSATLEALDGADLVLVVGSRLDEVTTQSYSLPRADQAVIRIGVDPDEPGASLPIERAVIADPGATLRAVVSHAPSTMPDLAPFPKTRGVMGLILRGWSASCARSSPLTPS
jgi:acetolactate synthase-1/2/3 large subunit